MAEWADSQIEEANTLGALKAVHPQAAFRIVASIVNRAVRAISRKHEVCLESLWKVGQLSGGPFSRSGSLLPNSTV